MLLERRGIVSCLDFSWNTLSHVVKVLTTHAGYWKRPLRRSKVPLHVGTTMGKRLAVDGSRIVKAYPIKLTAVDVGTRIQISRDPNVESKPKTGTVQTITREKRAGAKLTVTAYLEDQSGFLREIIWEDDAKQACIDVLEDKPDEAPIAPLVDPVQDSPAMSRKFAKADDQRKLQATTISQKLQECSMVVKFAFKRKDNPASPPNAGEADYDGMLNALGQGDRSNLKFYERELDRLNDALVAQGEDYTIGIVYALPLLAADGKEIAQSILMREQEGGPIFWAAIKTWLAEKTVKAVGDMLCDAFIYWVRTTSKTYHRLCGRSCALISQR